MLTIRPILHSELPLLRDFAPAEWKTDLSKTFSFHFGRPYYYPIAAELEGAIVGCAQGLINGPTGWLGNIIVRPEHRGRGIGTALTHHLVSFLNSKGCMHQILIATPMGEPIYRKLGFEKTALYLVMERDRPIQSKETPSIRHYEARDAQPLLALDKAISGEERQPFLGRFLMDAWVSAAADGQIDGFYLPGLSQGPILAGNDQAGLALLDFKLGGGTTQVVIPAGNSAALEHLANAGFRESNRLPRMALGEDTPWQPGKIFSRGSGYCG